MDLILKNHIWEDNKLYNQNYIDISIIKIGKINKYKINKYRHLTIL